MTPSYVDICACTSVVKRLLGRGYFPCAPKCPSMAFSVTLLDFISIHSLNVSPNTTAWSDTLETFWARRGPFKRSTGNIRKRLGMALTWYQVLDNRSEETVTAAVQGRVFGFPPFRYRRYS
ncbi:hypothetical protein AURDEDRAFT_64927 [Auricularia subglabra TFB-10046 SS5]|nr:hypothetical protein AURDEDRAFT_64927 [Auricularia subglabra TFB-10046 SS5]